MTFSLKTVLIIGALIAIPIFAWLFWIWTSVSPTITTLIDTYRATGVVVKQDLQTTPVLPFAEADANYQITDTKEGIDIRFANAEEQKSSDQATPEKKPLTLNFPKDYSKPIEVKLDDQRSIEITDLGSKGSYTSSILSLGGPAPQVRADEAGAEKSLFQKMFSFGSKTSEKDAVKSYLAYTSQDKRKQLLYAFQKDQATGEKKLKHWTLYERGDGIEQESYQFANAKIKVNEEGVAEVYYFGEQDIKNEQVSAQVDSDLMARAKRTLAKEMGEDISNGGQTPDFTIPQPYFIDNTGNKHDGEWKWNEGTKTLSVSLTLSADQYPIALDPTLSFTAPGQSSTGGIITGETTSNYFGTALTSGDFNADGRTDLAVGASGYSGSTGRAYIFYNGSIITENASGADVTITGEASSGFGTALTSGDFNADGRTDLAVGASGYTTNTGRAYIFNNDGSIPTTAATADVIVTGETTNNYFGYSLTAGDFNADGRTDLAVGARGYSSNKGRAYIFYNGSIITENASGADVTITGEASSGFGTALTSGDFNADGRTDLAVGAYGYSSFTGRVYIFYGDGSIPTTAGTADVIITGEASFTNFGVILAAGDLNTDGKTDLIVTATGYTFGRVSIFYVDGTNNFGTAACTGSSPTVCLASNADVKIDGDGADSGAFGSGMALGDFNADGRTDLALGSTYYNLSDFTGRVYIFYNDGSIPTVASSADIIITGETTNNFFGSALSAGDFNADGRIDLAVGAYGYSTNTGRAYIFYSQNGQVNTNQNITGGTAGDYFGYALTSGDWNSDGRTDLAVGASGYSTNTGRVYIFYNDGSIPTTATTADVTITGEATFNYFGTVLTSGDFNSDGRIDLAVGASGYSGSIGRAYIFYNGSIITENASGADVTITGETSSSFGIALTSGDFNADGRTDLAVGASRYSTYTGRVYIFYNDGSIPTTAATADVTITGDATNGRFGLSLTAGDFNADGTIDLSVGASSYSTNTGRAYIFYNDGSIPTTAVTADVIITGETSSIFGVTLSAGDFNADGRTDLAVGAYGYSSNTGRAYIFYNDGSIPTTAVTADVIITGETTSNYFGGALTSGDFNADGKTDLAVGARGYSGSTGRAYIFYNDGSIPTTAVTADVTITGDASGDKFGDFLTSGDFNADGKTDLAVGADEYSSFTGRVYLYETRGNFAWEIQQQSGSPLRTGVNTSGQELRITGESTSNDFGTSLTSGDFNADGRTDLAVGASGYSGSTGRVYIFYNDGSLSTASSNADVVITGETTSNYFGYAMTSGDFNADGRTDLAVGARGYSSYTGRAYIFYNDGSIPTTAGTADITITGEATFNYFGTVLTSGDFNSDGRTDLAVGASGYSGSTGRAYIFYNGSIITENASGADVTITGETSSSFGIALTSGDFNADGRTDLAVGARGYSSNTGRAYIFYNDGSIPTAASSADVTITGEATSNHFGYTLSSGDWNADGKIDLIVGAYGYSSDTGRAYIFYNDGSIPTVASSADVTITGENPDDSFGSAFSAGDFNNDGKIDLAVGASGYFSLGHTYIFYNDGSIPTTAITADVIIDGENSDDSFGNALFAGDFNADGKTDLTVGASGYSSSTGRVYMYTFGNDPVITGETSSVFSIALTSGDFNADGKTDLAVGASGYSSYTGRAYIFYNDGSIPATADTADITITGETTNNYFGTSLTSGDFNADGTTDLAIGANAYSSSTGRAYIFYNDGSIPTTAGSADVTITGETDSLFGSALTSGDFNADGKTDLAVGAYYFSSDYTGRVYIFYNDGSIPTTADTADVIITGETTNNSFGYAITAGDLNTDGKTDLVVSSWYYGATNTGRIYIFYGGSLVTESASDADIIITGEAGDYFGSALIPGDFNADGKTDLAVGASGYSSDTGRAYIFYNDGSIPTVASSADVTITGETASGLFGSALTSGDFNADGKTDLAVGASGYSSDTGRAYIFYNDGSIPTVASSADVTITGETASDSFGKALTPGDFNADSKTDLAIGATGYSSYTGRAYIFTTEASTAIVPNTTTTRGTVKFRGTVNLR